LLRVMRGWIGGVEEGVGEWNRDTALEWVFRAGRRAPLSLVVDAVDRVRWSSRGRSSRRVGWGPQGSIRKMRGEKCSIEMRD
jgi:hypothetical protein